MVATMADVLERPVGYEQQSFDDLGATMRRYGASDAFADGMVDMMRAKNNGLDAGVRRTPENTTITSFSAVVPRSPTPRRPRQPTLTA